MTFLPIVLRELRVRSRQKGTYRFRQAGALMATIIVAFMLMGAAGSSTPGKIGGSVFAVLSWLAFLFCLVEGVRNTADSLSEEKRAGTLGLLFLTDLKGYDVVLGKMVATSLNSLYVLLAILPPMAIPLLLGGVTAGEFWRLVLLLLTTLLLSVQVGLFASALSRDAQRALTASYLVVLFLVVLVFVPGLNAFTPVTAFWGLGDVKYRADSHNYWISILGTNALSLVLMACASLVLPRTLQERVSVPGSSGLSRVISKVRRSRPWHERRIERNRALAINPVMWAAIRRGSEPAHVWATIGLICFAALISFARKPGSNDVASVLLSCSLLVHFLLTVWVATEACHLFANARQSGAMELLLCTPVTVKEIVEGHFAGLYRLFFGPVVVLLVTEVVLLASFIYARGPYGISAPQAFMVVGVVFLSILVFVLDMHAVARFGMWMGLKSSRPGVAITKTVALVLLLPWLVGVPCVLTMLFLPIGLIVKDLVFINYSQEQLARQFRRVATGELGPEAASRTRRLPPVLP